MKLTLRIEFLSGESKDIVCSASDLVAFEDKFDKSISTLENDLKMTHLFFLAWHSEQRRKQTDKTFTDWLELVNSVGASEAKDPK